MLEKMLELGGEQLERWQRRAAMFTSIAIVIGVALISVIIYGAVRWAVAAAPNSPVLTQTTAAPTNAVSAIGDWLKNLVSGNSNGTGSGGTGIGGVGSSGGTIQVVSEESQVIKVVKQDSPAVVSIIASAQVPKMEQCAQSSDMQAVPPEFRQYFQGFSVPSLCQNGTQTERIGAGSGFLVSSDGYIVTNKHVVEDTKAEYTVVLNDEKNFGKKVTAKVVARDPSNDIAVLKIDMTGLPFLSFGDSDQLQVGQTAIAIGYSLGQFDNTVSKGVVSGLSRSIEAGEGRSSETLKGLIQTDAAINPGNSGGPLLDISGNVIGVNVAMADSAQSIGFTLPGNLARNAFEQVKQNGTIAAREQAFFGVRYIAITPELQSTEKLPYNYGMLIGRGDTATDLAVVPGSPADKAGISENDILLEVDGKQLNESYMLSDAVDAHKPGDVLKVKIYHKGQEKTVSVTLEKK